MTQQGIQFFRRANENVAIVNVLGFRRGVANSQTDGEPHGFSNFLQILVLLHSKGLQRHDVDGFRAVMALRKALYHAHVSEQRFSRGSWDGHQGVLTGEDGGNGSGLWRM